MCVVCVCLCIHVFCVYVLVHYFINAKYTVLTKSSGSIGFSKIISVDL